MGSSNRKKAVLLWRVLVVWAFAGIIFVGEAVAGEYLTVREAELADGSLSRTIAASLTGTFAGMVAAGIAGIVVGFLIGSPTREGYRLIDRIAAGGLVGFSVGGIIGAAWHAVALAGIVAGGVAGIFVGIIYYHLVSKAKRERASSQEKSSIDRG
jgi:hypothetical protein